MSEDGNNDPIADDSVDVNRILKAVDKAVGDKIRPLLERDDRKRKSEPSFKYRGNQKRYEFNNEMLSLFRRIGRAAAEPEPDFERIASLVEAAKSAILEQNKLVRLADRSKYGWATVDEYLSDDLASDSDDEKRMRAAEDRASKRSKTRAADASRQPFRFGAPHQSGYGASQSAVLSHGPNMPGPGYFNPFRPPRPFGFPGPRPFFGPQGPNRQPPPPQDTGCFNCGGLDHWSKQCPLPRAGTSKTQ